MLLVCNQLTWGVYRRYQRWTYRVDKKRVNEYGLVAKDMEDEEGDANATQAAAAGGEPAAKKAQ